MRAASSYIELRQREGKRKRERQREPREGASKRDRQRKHGGGRGTPCFDPRKRRRQSRRVLGSIPQGGRHSAALKPSASSLPLAVSPPPSPLEHHPCFSVQSPRRLPIANLRSDLPLYLALLGRSVSLFRPLSLRSPCTRYIHCSSFSLSLPPSVAILSLHWRSLRASLFPLSRRENLPQKQKREAKAARGSSRVVGGFFCYCRQMLCLVKRGEERRERRCEIEGERKKERECCIRESGKGWSGGGRGQVGSKRDERSGLEGRRKWYGEKARHEARYFPHGESGHFLPRLFRRVLRLERQKRNFVFLAR